MKEFIPALDFNRESYQTDLANILNWLGKMLDINELKDELVKYAKTINKEHAAKSLTASKVMLIGKLAYCLNRGAKLEQRSIDKIINALENADAEDSNTDESDEPQMTARTRAIISYVQCYSHIDLTWWSYVKESKDVKTIGDEIRAIIRKNSNSKSAILTLLCDHYREILDDAKNEKSLKTWVKPLTAVVDTIQLMLTTTKASKKYKKRNGTSVDKKAEKAATNLTYKAEDNEFGIKSMIPHSIIGAKAAVLFNTRNKHCEVYYAQDNQTLSIKGSYIVNFDSSKSATKTIRKPQENLVHWGQAATIRRLEVLFENTSGKSKPVKGKFNKNIVILKAIH